ncbi:MAG: porin [Acidobacteria bacterium]|nr:porin [Acidobacteriota bacterium]MBV9475378.1 porin [Acidobacteriota bacterium]
MKRLAFLLFACCAALRAHAEDAPTFSGFVDVAAVYNANAPASHENFIPGTGTSAKRANELALNLAELQWTRAVSAEQPVGFTLSVVAGDGETVVHGSDSLRYVYQASVAYRLPDGVVLEAGVYPSHIGFESLFSKDNWNYTRSWLGELSPYYQTGIKASYAFNAHWSAQLHVLNGWQLVHDNNDARAFGTQLAYTSDRLTASLNTFIGPELADDNKSLRTLGDVVAIYRLTPRLQLGGSYDRGSQQLPETRAARWRGLAMYARYTLNARHAFALRAEQFRDDEGAISGTGQTLREATLTWEMRPRDALVLKLETRYDDSNTRVFAEDARGRFLALIGAVVTF